MAVLRPNLTYSFLLVLILGWSHFSRAQHNYSIATLPEVCGRGSASLSITGTSNSDKIKIEWSNGQSNFTAIKNLEAGEYWVKITTESQQDSLLVTTDTTLHFTVEKEICPVGIPRHFSPNDDGYNDLLYLQNIEKHPDFEFMIFNKWGQRVHHQKKQYTPWTGDWNGFALPDGTYYYVLIYDAADKKQLQKGDITILR